MQKYPKIAHNRRRHSVKRNFTVVFTRVIPSTNLQIFNVCQEIGRNENPHAVFLWIGFNCLLAAELLLGDCFLLTTNTQKRLKNSSKELF